MAGRRWGREGAGGGREGLMSISIKKDQSAAPIADAMRAYWENERRGARARTRAAADGPRGRPRRHPEARAALVFTPSYYGTSADVKALADACHARDLPLVTDDAWGLDYSFGQP